MVKRLKGLDCVDMALAGIATRFVLETEYDAAVRERDEARAVIRRDHAELNSEMGAPDCICIYCSPAQKEVST